MKFFSFFLALLSFPLFAQTPIQLSNANMPSGGDTLRYSNANPLSIGNYTQTGTNFHWDFSNLQFTSQGLRQFKNATQTPYAFYFLSTGGYGEKIADMVNLLVLNLTDIYYFYKKQVTPTSAFITDGAGITFTGIPVPAYYSDKDELYNFPMTYPKHDSITFKFSTISAGTLIPISYSKTGYRISNVDGWGTITTPYGTENCLRYVTTQYSEDTVFLNIPGLPFPLPPLGLPNYQRSYQWLSATSKIPFLEVTGNLIGTNFVPTTVRYRDSVRNQLPVVNVGIKEYQDISALQMYPNPVSDKLFLRFKKADNYNIEIYDNEGKCLKISQTEAINTEQFIDVENLAAGLYVIKVMAGEKQQCFKFIKQ